MSISPKLLQDIRLQSNSIVQEAARDSSSACEAIEQKFRTLADGIPALIATASASGGSYAEVMTLRDQRDYTCETWKDRTFGKAPNPARLKGVAALVFVWCEENGLQPFLAAFVGNNRSESRIVIQWDARHLQAAAGLDGDFLAELQAATAEAQTREMVKRERERLQEVRTKIAEIRKRVQENSRRGWTSAIVGTVMTCSEKSDLRSVVSWAKDVIPYCENIGLRIRITAESSCETFASECWNHTVWVDWDGISSLE